MSATLHLGDCLDALRAMPDNSIGAVCTDPPYGLSAPPDIAVVLRAWLAGETYEHGSAGFMGRDWDSFVPGPRVWREVYRVLKPGGHAVVFAGTRTAPIMGISCQLGGLVLRDTLHWTYWSGFPKSADQSIAMDKLHGAEREVVATVGSDGAHRKPRAMAPGGAVRSALQTITAPTTDDAKTWTGYGTAVKPAIEPALLLRKPISESSIARNVLRWGTGALNIDACRFAPGDPMWPGPSEDVKPNLGNAFAPDGLHSAGAAIGKFSEYVANEGHALGRFPANLLSCPKASRREREAGCMGLPVRTGAEAVDRTEGQSLDSPRAGAGRTAEGVRNHHPTVKPLRLMRWLVRLVGCQPGSVILDPFMGSGTTGMAAVGQGFDFIGCELEADHMQIARARIEWAAAGGEVICDLDDIREPPRQTGLF